MKGEGTFTYGCGKIVPKAHELWERESGFITRGEKLKVRIYTGGKGERENNPPPPPTTTPPQGGGGREENEFH